MHEQRDIDISRWHQRMATQTHAQTDGKLQAAEAAAAKSLDNQGRWRTEDSTQQAQKRHGCTPEGSGRVDNVQGAMAKAGLSVCAPLWLLLVAVASWVAAPCAVAISLHHRSAGLLPQPCPALLSYTE